MPTYEYVCNSCGADLEIVQSMSEPSLTVCPECGAEGLRKLFRGVGIHFKGSGFYRTDSKEGAKSSSGSAPAAKSESSGKSESTKSESTSAANSDKASSTTSTASAAPAKAD